MMVKRASAKKTNERSISHLLMIYDLLRVKMAKVNSKPRPLDGFYGQLAGVRFSIFK